MKFFPFFLLLVSGVIQPLYSQHKVTEPEYRFRNSGIYRVKEIELTPQATRLQLLSEFIPGWWVQFHQNNLYIEDCRDGKKYYATEAEGIKWGEQKPTPKTGVDTFMFTFPPLPPGAGLINLIDGKAGIYGIKLTEGTTAGGPIPAALAGNWYDAHGNWEYGIYENLVIYKNQFWEYGKISRKGRNISMDLKNQNGEMRLFATLKKDGSCQIGTTGGKKISYTQKTDGPQMPAAVQAKPENFFQPGSKAVIQGYLRGYDTLAGFTNGMIYQNNIFTSEDYPTVATIYPDGRFETVLPLDYPSLNTINFGRNDLTFYVTPGDSLMIYIEWEDLLQADRYRNRQFVDFNTLDFMGSRARTNREISLASRSLPNMRIRGINKLVTKITPSDFLSRQTALCQESLESLKSLAAQHSFGEEACEVMQNKIYGQMMSNLMDFATYRKNQPADPGNKALSAPLENPYFDFLKSADLDNAYLFVPYSFCFFINQMEFNSPLREARKAGYPQPAVSLDEYALTHFAGLSQAEKDLFTMETPVLRTDEDVKAWRAKKAEKEKIYQRYSKEVEKYLDTYVSPLPKYTEVQRMLQEWKQKDSIHQYVLGLENNLVYETIKFHDLIFYFKHSSPEEMDTLIQASGITNPYIREQIRQKREKLAQPLKAYTLPQSKGADIFRKIVAPYKGKIVFVDFWATSCAPCRAGITGMKGIREKYKDQDVAFVFITDEKSSPLNAYEKFMKDVEGYKHRITESDYNYLRELFRFNGIPRYVLLDRKGDVINDNYRGNLDHDLQVLLETKD